MAELAQLTGATLFTTTANSVAQVLGIRVTLDSTGVTAAAASTVRGDFVTVQAIAAAGVGAAVSLQEGCIVPALASEAVAVNDPAYSDASGKWGKTSASHVLLGKWVQAASGDGVLGSVLIQTVA